MTRPASAHPLDRATWAVVLGLFAATVLVVALFRLAADLWWPATVLLFAPRWVALLPIPALAGLALLRDRTLLLPLGVVTILLIGPFMGFGLGLPRLLVRPAEGDLTVATLNARGGATIPYGPESLMDLLEADVLAIQECAGEFREMVGRIEERHAATTESLCIVSRLPILASDVMERDALRQAGGAGLVATHTLDLRGRPIQLTNVHLETPRAGLELMLSGRVGEGAELLRQKSILREIELRRAERWARERGSPALVLGDLNTPPESRHIRRIWSGWTDAFGRVGLGIGGTRLSGWIRPRIDHVMADDAWTVVRATVGEPVGSDHLPLVARVRLKDRAPSLGS